MPPKAAPSGSDATFNGEVASANDIKFMLSLVTNLQSKPDVNWDALAAALSLSKKSAIERWRVLRNKFNIQLPEGGGPTNATPARKTATKKAAANGNKNNNQDETAEDDGGAVPAKPATPAKAAGKGKKRASTAAGASRAAGESPAKKTKGKSASAAAAAAAAAPSANNQADNDEGLSSPFRPLSVSSSEDGAV